MEINEYVLERLAREKLDEARALAARRALVSGSRPALRVRLGASLIALGERLSGAPAPRPSCATPAVSRG